LIDQAPRFLFIPVSGPFGMGEYARSLAIANGIAARWPAAVIQFVLSRAAPYAAGAPYPTTLLDSSPTFHTTAVQQLIEQWSPDVVIFDNAGRTRQLRAAKRSGARVVYISARRRQRRKAFRFGWMGMIDEHWIAYPLFIAGAPGLFERLKLALRGRPTLRYLDVILDSRRSADDSLLARLGLIAEEFVLVVPGGGTGHPGADTAVGEFRQAARALAATGMATVFVGRPQGTPPTDANPNADAGLRVLGSVPQADLAELMRGAKLILANGGSTLLQGIACGKPCVAVPIAGDQRERIGHCVQAGVAVAAPLEAVAMASTALSLLRSESQLDGLAGRAIALGLTDGVAVALRAINALLSAPAS
jgi:glycosyltransferase involved in cell wall biosynthesis